MAVEKEELGRLLAVFVAFLVNDGRRRDHRPQRFRAIVKVAFHPFGLPLSIARYLLPVRAHMGLQLAEPQRHVVRGGFRKAGRMLHQKLGRVGELRMGRLGEDRPRRRDRLFDVWMRASVLGIAVMPSGVQRQIIQHRLPVLVDGSFRTAVVGDLAAGAEQ